MWPVQSFQQELQGLSEDLNYELQQLREALHWRAAKGNLHQHTDPSPLDSLWKDVVYKIMTAIISKVVEMFFHMTIKAAPSDCQINL
jgi:hypothetical protein